MTGKSSVLLGLLLLVAACGGNEGETTEKAAAAPDILTAATLGEQSPLTNAEYLAQEPYATADAGNGERQAMICRACHSFEKDGRHTIGPNLYGFFGTQVGTREGFGYSKVVQDANFLWTPRALDAWLAQPARFLPGNMMSFAGVRKAADRTDLIAYLLRATGEEDN